MPEYTLRLSQHELQILVNVMQEGPYRLVASLLGKIQLQVNEQEQAKAGEVE